MKTLNDIMISIFIPTYNRLAYTKFCINTLLKSLSENYKNRNNIKIVIIDDGSTDGTHQYLKQIHGAYHSYDVITALYQDHKGLAARTNEFWEYSKADILIKIDNDIEVRGNWLENMINPLLKFPELGISGGWILTLNPEDIYKNFNNPFYVIGDIGYKEVSFVGGIYAIKREVIEKNGYLQDDSGIWGWTGYQQKLKGFKIGYALPPAETLNMEIDGHPMCRRYTEYLDYLKEIRPAEYLKYLRQKEK